MYCLSWFNANGEQQHPVYLNLPLFDMKVNQLLLYPPDTTFGSFMPHAAHILRIPYKQGLSLLQDGHSQQYDRYQWTSEYRRKHLHIQVKESFASGNVYNWEIKIVKQLLNNFEMLLQQLHDYPDDATTIPYLNTTTVEHQQWEQRMAALRPVTPLNDILAARR